jgi:dihydrofolate reductase
MARVVLGLTVSVDGYIAGPNDDLKRLHQWIFEGAEDNGAVLGELMSTMGAAVMGRRMYTFAEAFGVFEDDSFTIPQFVVTHSVPEKVPTKGPKFTWVHDGVASAVEQAKKVAGDLNTVIMGGANIAQQAINLGLVDELNISEVGVILGDGIKLWDNIDLRDVELERTGVLENTGVTHLRYNVVR